jgi:DNA relaxase NicK
LYIKPKYFVFWDFIGWISFNYNPSRKEKLEILTVIVNQNTVKQATEILQKYYNFRFLTTAKSSAKHAVTCY